MNEKNFSKKVISNGETSLNSFPMEFSKKIQLPFNIFICGKHEKTSTPKAAVNSVLFS